MAGPYYVKLKYNIILSVHAPRGPVDNRLLPLPPKRIL